MCKVDLTRSSPGPFIWNVGLLQRGYMTLYPWRQPSALLPTYCTQISRSFDAFGTV